jgi:hypothetical protein
MKFIRSAKWATLGTVSALLLAACGGGGGSSDTLPTPTALAADGFTVGTYSYSQVDSLKGSVVNRVEGVLEVFTSTIPASSASNGFAGFGAILTVPAGKTNFTGQQALEVNLAVTASPSSGPTRSIKVQLKTAGAQDNGCLPTATVSVPASVAKFVLALDAATFPLPAFCNGPTATNPAIGGVLPNVVALQVEDGNIAATAVTSKLSIGKVGFTTLPPAPPPPPPPPPPVGASTLVASFATDANTTVQGAAIGGGFSFAENGANLSAPVKSLVNGNLLQWSSMLTGDQGGFSGSATQIGVAATTANWSTATSVSLQLRSDLANYQFRVILVGDATTGSCQYLQNSPAGSVGTTLSTVTLALSAFTADPFGGCNAVAGSVPTLAQVLANVTEIRVVDTSWNFATTGARTSANQVGDIRVLPGATPVAPPPPPVVPGTLVASFATDANTTVQGAAIGGGFSFAENGANLSAPVKSLVNGNLLQWSSMLTGDQGGFSGSATQIGVAATTANWSTATSVSLQLRSDLANYQFRVILVGDATTGSCQYLQNSPAGSVGTTLSTVTLALSAFTADPFGGCNAVAGSVPTLAQVLANVTEIRVVDTSWNFATTGARTSANQVGDIRILP